MSTNTQNANSQDIFAVKQAHDQYLAQFAGVHGIYTGRKSVAGKKTDTLAIVVVVGEKKPLSQLTNDEIIPKQIEGFPTDVIVGQVPRKMPQSVSGSVAARNSETLGTRPKPQVRRPLVGGAQISSVIDESPEAGTLGCIVTDGTSYYALTNEHVVGPVGNEVYQPDNGNSNFLFGTVMQSVANATIDAAVVSFGAGEDFANYVLQVGSIQGTYNLQTTDVGNCIVQKSGNITGLTFGTVEAIDYTVVDGQVTMTNQIKIEDIPGLSPFSQPGDSGAVVMNDHYQVVGLLWGGENNESYACAIASVLSQLNVQMVVDHCPPLYAVTNGYTGLNPSDVCEVAVYDTQWSPSSEINPWDTLGIAYSPRMTMFDDRLYNVRRGRGGTDTWCSKFDGAVWSFDTMLAPTSAPDDFYVANAAPSMERYFGTLHLVGNNSTTGGDLGWYTHTKGVWSPSQQLSFYCSSPPNLVTYKGLLYLFNSTSSGINYSTYQWSAAGGNFTAQQKAVPTSDPNGYYGCFGSPEVLTFNGKLYCFHVGIYNDNKIYCFSFDGTTWSDDQPLAPSGTTDYFETLDQISVVVRNGVVNCLYVDTGRQNVQMFTMDKNGVCSASNQTGFQSSGGVAAALVPTYHHVDFEIAPDVNNLYAAVEGDLYGLDLSNPSNQWTPNVPAEQPTAIGLKHLYLQNGPNETLFAITYGNNLIAANMTNQPVRWVDNYPSQLPVPFERVCAVSGGMHGTQGYIFGLDAPGNLYCALPPSGNWQLNYPNTQPAMFSELCSIDQGPQNAGTLYALDKDGSIWACSVPGGTWSSTAVPATPVPMASFSIAQWMAGMVNGNPVIQTNFYAIDTENKFWGCIVGQTGWKVNFPSAPPATLGKLFPTTASFTAVYTYAADFAGNYYYLNSSTGQWFENTPVGLPQPSSTDG